MCVRTCVDEVPQPLHHDPRCSAGPSAGVLVDRGARTHDRDARVCPAPGLQTEADAPEEAWTRRREKNDRALEVGVEIVGRTLDAIGLHTLSALNQLAGQNAVSVEGTQTAACWPGPESSQVILPTSYDSPRALTEALYVNRRTTMLFHRVFTTATLPALRARRWFCRSRASALGALDEGREQVTGEAQLVQGSRLLHRQIRDGVIAA